MRTVSLGLGIAALGAAWLGPSAAGVAPSFTVHMAVHLAVVAVAAPLIALGIGERAERLSVLRQPSTALAASVLEFAIVWAWHVPALHAAARAYDIYLVLEQGGFLFAGLLLWSSALALGRDSCRPSRAAGILALLLTAMHMTLLGTLLALAPRPLYPALCLGSAPLGLSAMEDQQLGGVLMLIVSGSVYLLGGLVSLYGLLRGTSPATARAWSANSAQT